MKAIISNLIALTLALPMIGCGEVNDGGQDSAGPDAGLDVPADTTAPTLISTTPADGDVGQLNDVQVVITFSEAMDQDSVEGSLDTSELGPVGMAWNGAGDTLTITPTDALAYAEGVDDPAAITAASYTVVLGDTAKDLAGNGLGSGTVIGFSTLKSVGIVIAPNLNMSRVVTPNGFLFTTDDPFVVGDVQGNVAEDAMRSVMTFDIDVIPATAHSIGSATLATRQLIGDLLGTPFTDLGSSVLLDHVTYVGIAGANAAFNSSQTAHSTVGDFFGEGQVVVQIDVTSQLDDDLAHRVDRADQSQFMARFDTITDIKNDTDRAVFSRDLLELSLTYLHP